MRRPFPQRLLQSRRAVPISLRLISMSCRFALVFVLAKILAPDDVGLYGLIASMTSYGIYLLGLDFYTFANRELVRSELSERRSIIRSQLGFEAIIYALVLPAFAVIFLTGLLPLSMIAWFYILVILEHVSLEINRILISLADQVRASIVLFVRMALLPLVVMPLMIAVPSLRRLDLFLGAWALCDVISVALGIRFVAHHIPVGTWGSINWTWVRRGLRTCLQFLVSTLCLRFLFTADRQVLHHAESLAAVAAYTFFMGIGNGITSVLDVTLYQFAYPDLIRTVHEGRLDLLKRKTKTLFVQALAIIAITTTVALLIVPVIVNWVGGSVYADYEWIMPFLLGAMSLYNLSMVPHYSLYGLGADQAIVGITVAATMVFGAVISVLLSSGAGAVITVVVAIAAASTVLLVAKTLALWRHLKRATPPGDSQVPVG